jgi:hypothetical protein
MLVLPLCLVMALERSHTQPFLEASKVKPCAPRCSPTSSRQRREHHGLPGVEVEACHDAEGLVGGVTAGQTVVSQDPELELRRIHHLLPPQPRKDFMCYLSAGDRPSLHLRSYDDTAE